MIPYSMTTAIQVAALKAAIELGWIDDGFCPIVRRSGHKGSDYQIDGLIAFCAKKGMKIDDAYEQFRPVFESALKEVMP